MEEEKRVKFWDNIKGVLIILVVLGHFLYELRSNLTLELITKVIYLFHMPAFVFLSGYFSQSESARENEKLFRFLFYYAVGNIFFMWFSAVMYRTTFNLLVPYYSYWYLIALVVWRKGINYITKSKAILPLSIIGALLIGLFPEVDNTLALSRITCFFPFFLLGYGIKKERVKQFLQRKGKKEVFLGLVLICTIITIEIIVAPYLSLDELLMDPYTNQSQILNRLVIFIIALGMIYGISMVIPKGKIPFLTKWGKNSLYIYIYHRLITLLVAAFWEHTQHTTSTLVLSIAMTVITCWLTGNDWIAKITEKTYETIKNTLKNKTENEKLLKSMTAIILLLTLCMPLVMNRNKEPEKIEETKAESKSYEFLSEEEQSKIENAVSILFVGDLILLKEQVNRGYNVETKEYNFEDVFSFTKEYIEEADFSIGVLEGPMAGENMGYSNSNFDDGITIYLNYPEEFGVAIKNAGFDLVTLANNHILDKGEDGAIQTLNTLEKIGLEYTGAFRDKDGRKEPQIIEKEGLKIGILAYTYGCNYYSEEELLNQDITPVLVERESQYFQEVKEQVIEDFEILKQQEPDVIVVLPHMGTQFSNEVDEFQETWNEIFIEQGATIILGDHSHAVQPIQMQKNQEGKETIIVNSPGNFANSYQEQNGDATAMVEIYLEKGTGNVIGSSVIPMWVQATMESNYRAIPIHDIMKKKAQISTYELKRVREVYELITEVMIGNKLNLENTQKKLYLLPDGYKRSQEVE